MFHVCPVFSVVLVEDIGGVAVVNLLPLLLYLDRFKVEVPVCGEKIMDTPAVESSREGMTGIVHRKGNTRATDETTFETVRCLSFHFSLALFMKMSDYGEPW